MNIGEPIWLNLGLVEAIHERQIAEHGGGTGMRDRALLESALARPQQRAAYGGAEVELTDLAAAYAFGIARNHPFVDGNKRTAYIAMRLFLLLNGWELVAPMPDRYQKMIALAAGELEERELADWLRTNSRPEQVSEPEGAYG